MHARTPLGMPVPAGPGPRTSVITGLAAALLPLQSRARLLVAVDGVDGAGKTTFADELASALRIAGGSGGRQVLRVGLDDFHNLRAVRYRPGRSSPDGFRLDSYNLRQFTGYVLEPLRRGDPVFRDRGHDLRTDAVLEPEPVPAAPDAIILIDGLFLHREELRTYWDYSFFLDVPFDVTAERMALRDGSPVVHPHAERYMGGQRGYFAADDPAARADLVLDNSRPGTLEVISAGDVSYRQGR